MPLDQWLPPSIGVLTLLSGAAGLARLGFLSVSAKSWPEVQGTIVSSVVQRGRRRSARARVRYAYRVGQEDFTSDRLWFGEFFEANARIVEERVKQFAVGTTVTVRHHPTRPALCCLEPRADVRVWLFLGGTMIMAGVILDAVSKA